MNDNEVLVTHRGTELALGHSEDLYFVLWRNRTTLGDIETLRAGFDAFIGSRSRRFGLITTIAAGAQPPGAEEKKTLASLLSGGEGKIAASAILIEGEGFAAASVRFVVTGLTMLARQAYPHRAFKRIEDASLWFETTSRPLEVSFQASRVSGQYQAFRRLVEAH